VLTGKGDPIGAFIALLAVPLPPISTLSAYLTVPGVTMLDHGIPTKRVPKRLSTFLTGVITDELTERDRFTPTRQFVLLRQFFF
jgi:hypothetical protein